MKGLTVAEKRFAPWRKNPVKECKEKGKIISGRYW